MASFCLHDFYCLDCGQKSLTLPRQSGHLHKKFHRKKLYCRNCKCYINHIECRNDFEVWEFEDKWRNGTYIDEAAASREYGKEDNNYDLFHK